MKDTIFMTGGTGFLGTELAARLIRDPEAAVYVLVRAADEAEGVHRLKMAWYHEKTLYECIGKRVFPVPGDLTKKNLGLDRSQAEMLRDTVTLVLHVGAEVGFRTQARELDAVNIGGTKRMLALAARMPKLRRFVHVSTAYVAGQRSGVILEEEAAASFPKAGNSASGTSSGRGKDSPAWEAYSGKYAGRYAFSGIDAGKDSFSSKYERSKAYAESEVCASGLPYTIVRPGMIVGDSQSGWVRQFNTVYYVLKQMLLGKLRAMPVSEDTPVNIVPGDYVADLIVKACEREEALGRIFHLTCPPQAAPTAGELAEHVRLWAKQNLMIQIPKMVFLPAPFLRKAGAMYNHTSRSGQKKGMLHDLVMLMPYFFGQQEFDRTNTEKILSLPCPTWRDYIDRLLDFACRKNFMRQSGMTVFEQARVRRESTRYPIRYYDITKDGIRQVTGPAVNRRISRILDAFYAWGIQKGDRIALTGINSVDYLALEQAIGLAGAVSVPIYYTTPAQEAAVLLEKSGASWFFIGDRRMLDIVGEIDTSARIVGFSVCRDAAMASGRDKEKRHFMQEEQNIAQSRHCKVMPWEEFLSEGESGVTGGKANFPAPDPEDLATIRYTSGTTGEPKGVMFNYAQLAWMGEVMTALVSWEDRNRPMRYLSFLPLSHVVEGILASYAPYYMLTQVDYYFLNDFGALTEALPKVRPTIFFSVPRFYEKVWDQASSNVLGKMWLASSDEKKAPARRAALGKVLRYAVLKKAGIDQCRQLIVGSAPVSEKLLLHFRELGIEIYNAYGQTEAPLITINRIGDNVIPTIGTPLPETFVTAKEDGELIVEGPQVALGYYGLETETIVHGTLKTGDLGIIHENGHITLNGRKKDFIITAYGKNISISKLEERLKDIGGVSEAVLIGENRPYCTALLWMEKGADEEEGLQERLSGEIARLNETLSHPEQIRKFRVIGRPLSIQEGELTPNLKVKRGNVQEHFSEEIEQMYCGV